MWLFYCAIYGYSVMQNMEVLLRRMWLFYYAECGCFIAQNVDVMLCQVCIDAVCGSMVPAFSIDKAVYETACFALRNRPYRIAERLISRCETARIAKPCVQRCAHRVHKNSIALSVSALCTYPQVINSIDLFGFVSEI